MDRVKPLPAYLVKRYKGWKATSFEESRAWFQRLAFEGQRPRTMIISCCDSRVQVSTMFEADAGEFFIHRNIAAMVPPYQPDDQFHGTSAAIEYAVTALKVANLIVVGHSNCGGVEGAFDMFAQAGKSDPEPTSFVGNWLRLLKPGYDNVCNHSGERNAMLTALEKETVLISLQNLMTFPFIEKAVADDVLSLHGLWVDIAQGQIEAYDVTRQDFEPV